MTAARVQYMATALILMADQSKYGRLDEASRTSSENTQVISRKYMISSITSNMTFEICLSTLVAERAQISTETPRKTRMQIRKMAITLVIVSGTRRNTTYTVSVVRKYTLLVMKNVKKKKKRKKNSMFKTAMRMISQKSPVKGVETYNLPKIFMNEFEDTMCFVNLDEEEISLKAILKEKSLPT